MRSIGAEVVWNLFYIFDNFTDAFIVIIIITQTHTHMRARFDQFECNWHWHWHPPKPRGTRLYLEVNRFTEMYANLYLRAINQKSSSLDSNWLCYESNARSCTLTAKSPVKSFISSFVSFLCRISSTLSFGFSINWKSMNIGYGQCSILTTFDWTDNVYSIFKCTSQIYISGNK